MAIGEKDAPADDGEHEVEARCGVFGEGTDALGFEAVGIHAEYGIGIPPVDIAPGEIEGAAGGAEVIGRMEVVALPYPLEFGAVGAQAIDARPAADIVPVPVGGRKALGECTVGADRRFAQRLTIFHDSELLGRELALLRLGLFDALGILFDGLRRLRAAACKRCHAHKHPGTHKTSTRDGFHNDPLTLVLRSGRAARSALSIR